MNVYSALGQNATFSETSFHVWTWRGITQEILVLDSGYSWRGKSYASLSEVARAITGTRWSGPRFFGLQA